MTWTDRCDYTLPDWSNWLPGSTTTVEVGDLTVMVDGSLQTETVFACAFDDTDTRQGWVFSIIDDNLNEATTGAVDDRALGFRANDGTWTAGWSLPAGWSLGDCTESEPQPTLRCECMVDDQGAGVLVPYVTVVAVSYDADANVVSTTQVGSFTDDTYATTYAPTGTPTPCDEVGDEVLASKVECVSRCDDLGGGTYVSFVRTYLVQITINGATATEVGTGWTDATMTTPYAVVGTEVDCDTIGEDVIASNLHFECRCDDHGDGTATSFHRAYFTQVTEDLTPVVMQIGTGWTDETLATPYTVTGTEVDCDSIGDELMGVQAHTFILGAGGSWTAPALVQSIGFVTTGNGGTVTDSDGTVSDLVPNRARSWTAQGKDGLIRGNPIVVTAGDAAVEITYTTLST